MKYFTFLLFTGIFFFPFYCQAAISSSPDSVTFFGADNPNIQYTGRIDFSNPREPKFWSSGVYIKARFKGTSCEIEINDEVLYGNTHNYLEIVVDNGKPFRIQTTGKTNSIKVAEGLSDGAHTVLICKDTESGNGYLIFRGLPCEVLLPLPDRKSVV